MTALASIAKTYLQLRDSREPDDRLPILRDTGEQQIPYWLFRRPDVDVFDKHLSEGDYSILGWEMRRDGLMIEHKRLGELCTNWTKERPRFERMWIRAFEMGYAKKHLVIEGRMIDVPEHNYRSEFYPTSFEATLNSWQQKYHFDIHWLGAEDKWLECQMTIRRICEQFRRMKRLEEKAHGRTS